MLASKLLSTCGGTSETLYADDVFSTWLRTGTGADATITTGIDMTKGYMLWSKGRSGATDHAIYDSARGVTFDLVSNSTAAQTTQSTGLKAVGATGHTVGSLAKMNTSGATYVDFVFRKAAKFFDVVPFNQSAGSTTAIAHSLGVAPGMVLLKTTGVINFWAVYHISTGNNKYLTLNSTSAAGDYTGAFSADATQIVVNNAVLAATGNSFVAYLFAHDTSADGIVQCGSYTGSASDVSINLGNETQFVFIKNASRAGTNWLMLDTMRGMPLSGNAKTLSPNLSDAESSPSAPFIYPTATGFTVSAGLGYTANYNGDTYIYLAIRRPNKPPTTGTQVYNAIARTGVDTITFPRSDIGFDADLAIGVSRNATSASYMHQWFDRPRGFTGANGASVSSVFLQSTSANAEVTTNCYFSPDNSGGFLRGAGWSYYNMFCSFFKRAPGVFDVVCYAGTGSARTVNHSLGVAPELMIVKQRSGSATDWFVYNASIGNTFYLSLNSTAGSSNVGGSTVWNSTSPTSTGFSLGTNSATNGSGQTYIAYLFATKAGLSKCGSYTGNGSSQTIDMGFSTGARFFLVKASSTTGDWWVYDSVRGIVSAADPALRLNSTAVEVTSADAVDPASVGIVVNQEGTCSINASGVSYIYLSFA